MKKTLIIVLGALILSACNTDKDQEKALLNEIIKMHDQVMGYDEHAMQNKMKLDTLLAQPVNVPPATAKDTLERNTQIRMLLSELHVADVHMEDWMHAFNPDQKEKAHQEVMDYLTNQRAQLYGVEDLLTTAIKHSDDFLKNNKKPK